MTHDVESVTKTEHRVVISTADLAKWLSRKEGAPVNPRELSATIQVPSGADYSGMRLSLEEVGGIVVTWSEIREEK